MNNIKDPDEVLNQLRKELVSVNDDIGKSSLLLRSEKIEFLTKWNEKISYLLYRDPIDYKISRNLFEQELTKNRQYLRNNMLDLDDYKLELEQFIILTIEPFKTAIQTEIKSIEEEIELTPEPIKPEGYSDEYNGLSSTGYKPGEYEKYEFQYERWEVNREEPVDYREELLSLVWVFDFIIHTIDSLGLRNKSMPTSQIDQTIETSINRSEIVEKDNKTNEPDHPRLIGFDAYIHEQYKATLLPHLINKYNNQGPKNLVPMLYALVALKITSEKDLFSNQVNLHKALQNSFGNIGGRTSLNAALLRYDPKTADSEYKRQIEHQRQQIENLLKTGKPD